MAAALAMTGCTTTISMPERPQPAQVSEGLSFAEGIRYLYSARAKLEEGRRSVGQIDDVTKLGTGVGVGGGALVSLARGPADVALGSLIVGGTSYSINQTIVPQTRMDVIDAGMRNLQCLEESAIRIHRETRGSRSALQPLRDTLNRQLAQLRSALDDANDPVKGKNVAANLKEEAGKALESGQALVKAMDQFLWVSDVGTGLYLGASRTLDEVNIQLRARSPDIAKIARVGASIADFVALHAGEVNTQAAAARKALGSIEAATQSANPVQQQLVERLDQVRATVASAQSQLPPPASAQATLLSDCKTHMPGEGPVTLTPAGPLVLEPGGQAFHLSIDSDLAVEGDWEGKVPADSQMSVPSISGRSVRLAALAGAKPDTYRFFVRQKENGKRSNVVEIQIQEAAARQIAKAAQGPKAAQQNGIPMAQWRNLLGLNNEPTLTEQDEKWINRVKRLESCVQLPVTGKAGPALAAALAKREKVDDQGDCPNLKAPAAAQPPASGASSPAGAASTPVPPTPKLK